MPGMTGEETTSYISHHLKLAGRSGPLFSDDAITFIPRHQPRPAQSRQQPGHPGPHRRLRQASKAIVDESSARTAATEVTAD